MVICYIGLGSNLGNRRRNISEAIKRIDSLKGTEVVKVSKIIETDPIGGLPRQSKFLNGVLKIKTELTPAILLKNLQEIEQQLGRLKRHIRNGPRTIDLDILFYGNNIIRQKELKVPHPKILERDFVLKPLLEVI